MEMENQFIQSQIIQKKPTWKKLSIWIAPVLFTVYVLMSYISEYFLLRIAPDLGLFEPVVFVLLTPYVYIFNHSFHPLLEIFSQMDNVPTMFGGSVWRPTGAGIIIETLIYSVVLYSIGFFVSKLRNR